MQKNEEIIIDITDITDEGSGVGRYEGMAVFVPMTAVGDRVRAKLLKVKKNCAYARAEEILISSPDREENTCPCFRQCGGCVFRHISYEAECRLKQKRVYEAVKRIGGVDMPPEPIIPSDSPDRYRNKAQYPVAEDGSVGFYAFHSHRIVKCGGCALQPEIFGKIAETFSGWAAENKISVYDEEKHKGLLRHLYIRLAEKTGEIMVCVVINGSSLPFWDDLVSRLCALCGERLKSVQININREKTNVILGKECKVIYGGKYITDVLCGVKVRLSPLSFYQVNRGTAEKLYRKAAEYAEPDGKAVLDLYCGAGTIGLSMADRAEKIIGAEIVPEAVYDARFNAKLNGIENAEFICADAADAAAELAARGIQPSAVIVDPPRKGCSSELIEIIAQKFRPERVVYVSCDPATLARDIKLFGERGYRLNEYTPVDMFPRTGHVETVVLLSKGEIDSNKVRVEFSLEDMDMSGFQKGATYEQIKAYVLEHSGLKVSSLYISQVKRKCGIIERDNYNKPKSEDAKQPQCPLEKELAIRAALEHFGMI